MDTIKSLILILFLIALFLFVFKDQENFTLSSDGYFQQTPFILPNDLTIRGTQSIAYGAYPIDYLYPCASI